MKKLIALLMIILPSVVLGQSDEANELYEKGFRLYKSVQFNEALTILQKSDSLEKAQLNKKSPNYYRSEKVLIDIWEFFMVNNSIQGNYSDAMMYHNLMTESIIKIYGKNHPYYNRTKTDYLKTLQLATGGASPEADEYYNQGKNLLVTQQAHLAIPYFVKSDSIEKSQSPKYHRSELMLIKCWKDLAGYNADIHNGTEAIRYQSLIVDKCKQLYGKKHSEYIDAEKTLNSYRKMFSNKGFGADEYYNKGMEYLKIPLPYDASTYFLKSDSIEKATLKPDSPNYYRSELALTFCWEMLANYFNNRRNYSEAIRNQILVVEHRKKILGEADQSYINAVQRLAFLYYRIQNIKECINQQTYAVQISKNAFGENNEYYCKALSSLAEFYDVNGYPVAAINLQTHVAEIAKIIFAEDQLKYSAELYKLAVMKYKIGRPNEAIALDSIVLNIEKKFYSDDSPDYANRLELLANSYTAIGNYAEAINIYNKMLSIYEKYDTEPYLSYQYWTYRGIAIVYARLGNYTEAIKYQNRLLDYEQTNNSDFTTAGDMLQLADYYHNSGQDQNAKEKTIQAFTILNTANTNYVIENFGFLSNKERAEFWSKGSDFFIQELPRVAYTYNDTTLNAIAYNGQLFAKGFLLNSELEILHIFEQKGNQVLVDRYNKLKENRAILDELYNTPSENRSMDVDSLATAINKEEHKLVEYANELGGYTQNLLMDWKEIQKNLKINDLAIEFAFFNDTNNQQIYVALVLNKDMKAPQIVKLFNSDDLHLIKQKDYYSTPKLYNLVWKPLSQYLKGIKNVYFSPIGKFHTIGIEYLPDDNGNIFGEKYATYRLSSTRELAIATAENLERKAATFGGILYENNHINTNIRGNGASFLVGTKNESEIVAKFLQSADYNVIALSDTIATEDSFKKLSNSGLKILHIGTHGFYFTENELKDSDFNYLTEGDQTDEDRALSCSGLLFAGANAAFSPETRSAIPEGSDDGILTAKEISRLNFQGLDLVVLSACQSGLGEVTGDGVFGLQRGFKKAGAHTIVMSLWNVSDDATQLLMTEFFKNLTSGMKKREAFVSAQKIVRQKFPHPGLWAAFVMVDGL